MDNVIDDESNTTSTSEFTGDQEDTNVVTPPSINIGPPSINIGPPSVDIGPSIRDALANV